MKSFLSDLWYGWMYSNTASAYLLGFGARIERRHGFPAKGPVLVVANHQSFLDPPVVGLATGRRLVYLARKSLFKNAFLAGLIRSLDAVPIDQDGVGKEGIRTILNELGKGRAVLVFPEGSRTPDGQMHEFKPGIHLLIKKTHAPIVPVGIAGAYEAWPEWRKYPKPAPAFWPWRKGSIGVAVGKAFPSEDLARLPREESLAILSREIAKMQARAEEVRRKK